jgi:tripartite-type tricarboxylate transporter receptor subunit TctC
MQILLRWLAAACAIVALVLPSTSMAQDYPSRPVKLLVPFPAASSTDQVARLLGAELQARLGEPFVPENKPGAQGTIAADALAKSNPDGYTLLLATNSIAASVSLFKTLPFDPIKDLQPIARIGFTGFVAMVRPDYEAKSMADLVALARKRPGTLTAGFGGGGGQVSQALLKSMANLDVVDVPYRGVPQAVTDLLGGNVSYAWVDLGNAGVLAQGGRLMPLGVTLPTRTDLAPGVPTIAETVPNFQLVAWFGLFAPAGTPPAIVEKLHEAVVASLDKPEIRKGLAITGTDIAPLDPQRFGAFLRDEIPRWAELVKLSGLKPE